MSAGMNWILPTTPTGSRFCGSVAERLKALVLKTSKGVMNLLRGFESHRFRQIFEVEDVVMSTAQGCVAAMVRLGATPDRTQA